MTESATTPSKHQRLVHEAVAIVLLALGLLLFLSLVSWDANDPGFDTTSTSENIHNWIGPIGAYLSSFAFTILGYGTWLLSIAIVSRAIKSIRRFRNQTAQWSTPIALLRSSALLFLVASFCALLEVTIPDDASYQMGPGGELGLLIAPLFTNSIGFTGSILVLLGVFLGACTLFLEISWLELSKGVLRQIVKLLRAISAVVAFIASKLKRRPKSETPKPVKPAKRRPLAEPKPKAPVQRSKPQIVDVATKAPQSDRALKERQITLLSDGEVQLPTLDLLDPPTHDDKPAYSSQTLEAMSQLLEARLKEFNISATVEAVLPGPVVTRFEIMPAAGIKGSRITSLARDLARSLAVKSVRVVEIIPGKPYVGIEIPNENRQMVMLQDVLNSKAFDGSKSPLTLALGHDISGQPVVGDLAKMPHLLVAGTTGSGKSVGINVMLLSLLFKSTPDEVRLILIDPKMLELSVYDDIPHLLTPVVTDMEDAENGLRWCVGEMERRYKLMSKLGVRNLAGYNRAVNEAKKAGTPIKDPLFNPETVYVPEGEMLEIPDLGPLPSIVVVIDEFADMMMIVGKKVEQLIARIAQKARAAGIHLILATQRPSVDVITGLIKANVPTRIAFQVSSKIDSRTILDQGGAEQLLGHGDMLYLAPGTSNTQRVHGAFVDDHEVHAVVAKCKEQGAPNYINDILEDQSHVSVPGIKDDKSSDGGSGDESDPLYDDAVAFVTESRKASVSSVQRQLRVGYNRAARLVEAMEVAGVVSEAGHNGARKVLAPKPVR